MHNNTVLQQKVIISKSTFYKLLEIEASDADTIVKVFENQRVQDGINVKKIIGIAIDSAHVVVGEHHFFSLMLREVVPHLTIGKCMSHSYILRLNMYAKFSLHT